jgi:CubicO group peptidase (beta-lactamase class C family)
MLGPMRIPSLATPFLVAYMFTQSASAGAAEDIGTVTQVYDGTLTSDIQVRTFRNMGLSATLRDYGRFGLFLMNDGVAGGERILPEGWVRDAGSSKTIGGKVVDYGYMIWPFAANPGTPNQGAFQALGIYGQHIYVNPREKVVIVVWGALPKPTGKEVIADEDFFAAATAVLR